LQHLDHSFTNKSLNLIKVCSFVIKLWPTFNKCVCFTVTA
jgi:hypothetical protein